MKPGFFAKGVILTQRDEDVLAVPDAAVSTLAGVSSVYVVQDGKIAQQSITLGVRQSDLWEVVDGLKGTRDAGDQPAQRAGDRASAVTTGGGGRRAPAAGGGRRGNGGGRRGQQGDTK